MVARLALALVIVSVSPLAAAAGDAFDGVKCDAEVAKALAGKRSPEGRVEEIAKKYAALGLKDLGGDEWTDPFFLASWRICGAEYLLLEEKRGKRWTIVDVLRIPAHSRERPQFAGTCRQNGEARPDLWAILENKPVADLLPAVAAWHIDTKKKKFVAVATDGLTCPRDGIATVDGGK